MPANDTPSPMMGNIVLPPMLNMIHADALHGTMQAGLEADGGFLIDASGVEVVSTACLQVLVAAALAARAGGRAFAFSAASPVLCGAARDLGLAGHLGLDAA